LPSSLCLLRTQEKTVLACCHQAAATQNFDKSTSGSMTPHLIASLVTSARIMEGGRGRHTHHPTRSRLWLYAAVDVRTELSSRVLLLHHVCLFSSPSACSPSSSSRSRNSAGRPPPRLCPCVRRYLPRPTESVVSSVARHALCRGCGTHCMLLKCRDVIHLFLYF